MAYAKPQLGLRFVAQDDLTVKEVFAGTSAAKAGVQVGDRLVSLGGRAVRDHGEVVAVRDILGQGAWSMDVERSFPALYASLEGGGGAVSTCRVSLAMPWSGSGRRAAPRLGVNFASEDDLTIRRVADSGSALHVGDVMRSVDNNYVASRCEVLAVLDRLEVGDECLLKVEREGKMQVVRVTLRSVGQ